jgi:hypothetical protein
LSPQWCLSPLCFLTFFIRSRFSRSLVSSPLVTNWESVPSFQSFLLFRNHSGIPCPWGSDRMFWIVWQSFSLSCPALIILVRDLFLEWADHIWEGFWYYIWFFEDYCIYLMLGSILAMLKITWENLLPIPLI